VPAAELEQRIISTYRNLGTGSAIPGKRRCRRSTRSGAASGTGNGIPLSEVVFAVILLKQQLRKYIREHGLVEHSGTARTRWRSSRFTCTGSRN